MFGFGEDDLSGLVVEHGAVYIWMGRDWVTALAWRCGGVRGCAVMSLGALTSSMRDRVVVYLSGDMFGKFGIGQSPLAGRRTPRPRVTEPAGRRDRCFPFWLSF